MKDFPMIRSLKSAVISTIVIAVPLLALALTPLTGVYAALLTLLALPTACCLTAMTFPSILSSTASILSGAAALAVAVVLAYRGKSLIVVALSSSAAVLIVEWAMTLV